MDIPRRAVWLPVGGVDALLAAETHEGTMLTECLWNIAGAADDLDVIVTDERCPDAVVSVRRAMREAIDGASESQRIAILNDVRRMLSAEFSPFASEPVDCVQWVPGETVVANGYNPNSVAPPEMELLRVSIMSDGYTQPIVTNAEGESWVVVDGFHRNRVGKECPDVRDRLHGYLPVVQIKATRTDEPDRMASTIRHNRARGKHQIDGMSDIVLALKRRNWSDAKIGKELGMDTDEVLRLAQITGLAEAFKDRAFSLAWEAEIALAEDDDLREAE